MDSSYNAKKKTTTQKSVNMAYHLHCLEVMDLGKETFLTRTELRHTYS